MSKLYKSFIWFLLSVACIGLPFSFLAFGSDLSTRQSNLYPYKSSIFLQDDFVTGIGGSGTIGELGWNLSSGTAANQASETGGRIGIIRRDTTAVINTYASITLFNSSNAIDTALPHIITWAVRLNTNDANTTLRIGSTNSAFAAPANGVYFEKLDADTNWFCVTRAGGVQTRTDSTIATNTSFNTFVYSRQSSGVTFSINGTSVCGTHTTNIPANFYVPSVAITNSAAAAKTVDLDYFEGVLTGLTR